MNTFTNERSSISPMVLPYKQANMYKRYLKTDCGGLKM